MKGSNKAYFVFGVVAKWFICYSLLLSNSALAVDGFNRLEKIGFSAQPGNRVQVQLTFAGPAITPQSFSTDNPARIVLDFPNTKLGLRKKYKPIGIGAVHSTRAVETRDRIRVVLNLVRKVPFNVNVVGNRLLVSVENMASQSTGAQTGDSFFAPPPSQPILRDLVPHIQNIDFRRTPDAAGRIAITLSNPSILVEMRQEAADIVLEFPNTKLPKQLNRRLDVLDFGTPISFIDTFPVGRSVRMNVTVRDNYEYHAYQTGNLYIIEVNKKAEVVSEVPIEERQYEGQLVSFNFQDIDVRAVLKLLFDLPGVNLNMIAGNEVAGSLSLRLKNVPWDQALDIILEARGLGMRKIGNVVIIDIKKNLDARKHRELEAQKKIKELEPLHTEFIAINYAKAKDLEGLLRTRDDHSFLSKRGSVSTDERTNTLIIQDTASKIAEIRKLIASLDTPIRQVLIESRIVIATSNFNKDLGVKFGYSANQDLGNGYGAVLGGKVEGDTEFYRGTAFTTDDTEGFLLSLPANATNPARVGLAIGKIGSYLLQLELSAMQSEGSGEILSSPRLITGNQQEATIMQGTQIAFPTAGGVGTSGTIEWKDATIELKVTPQITPDDRVNLELSVKKDARGAKINGLSSIDKREVKTNVLVNNGETIVLGGVYERSTTNSFNRVPFFADLPLLGFLFKNRSSEDIKSELLIFVTPKILKESP
ncbi:MAG: type IV pilus secretin PilQ [Pseudomonadota bacterium]